MFSLQKDPGKKSGMMEGWNGGIMGKTKISQLLVWDHYSNIPTFQFQVAAAPHCFLCGYY
jgi:hypothetical protein